MRWEVVFYEILDHETKLLQDQNRFFSWVYFSKKKS